MGFLAEIFNPDVATLKKHGKTRKLLGILEREPFSKRGVEAIEALGELHAREGDRPLQELFRTILGPDVPFPSKPAFFEVVLTALACVEDSAAANDYLKVFRRSCVGNVREYSLAIGMLGHLGHRSVAVPMSWQLTGLGSNLSQAYEGERMLLLIQALAHLQDEGTVAALVVAMHELDDCAGRNKVEPYFSMYVTLASYIRSVLKERFGIDEQQARSRVAESVYSVFVAYGLDKADQMVAGFQGREKVKREYRIQDETLDSVRTLVEECSGARGWCDLGFRLSCCHAAARQRFGKWADARA